MTIKDLRGNEPIGAALTIGIKGANGAPTERDRFHLVAPREDGSGRRPYLPQFGPFNGAKPEHRKFVRGYLVHGTRDECFQYQLLNHKGPRGKAHPDNRPWCTGDGEHAERWMGGGPDDFQRIECPHDKCEFRAMTPPLCKPFSRLLFRVAWKDGSPLPTPLVKFTTGAWSTTRNLLGLFDHIENSAREMGIESYSLFGFPFSLQLTEGTKRSSKSRFPVVIVSAETDVLSWLIAQQRQLSRLRAPPPVAALTGPEEAADDVIAADYDLISAPIVPVEGGR